MKEKISNIVIAVLVAATVAGYARISSLKTDIQLIRHDHENAIRSMEQKISNIHRDVDEQMKKQASLFSDISQTLGKADLTNKSAEVSISLVPKTVVDGMGVKVSLGDKSVELKRGENGSFTGILSVGLFEEYDTAPLAVIRTGNETKTEYLENVAVAYLWPNYLPGMEMAEIWNDTVTFKEESDVSESTLTVNGNMELSLREAELSPEVVFEKIYAVAETENGETARKLITEAVKVDTGAVGAAGVLKEIIAERTGQGDGSVMLSSPFREIYKIGESEYLRIYIVAEDSFGYVHKACAYEWHRPDRKGDTRREPDSAPEWAGAYNRGEVIYDKDGKLLYGKEI